MKLRGGASEEEERGGGLGGMGADWKAMEELRSVQCFAASWSHAAPEKEKVRVG